MLNVVPNPANQSLGNSRDLIKNNFGTIDTTFTVNHVQYNDGSGNGGFHQFINLPSGVPIGATNNGTAQVALYANAGTSSTVPELFFQRNNLAANTGYAFTEGINIAPGYTRMASGTLVKWGTISTLTNGVKTQNITFPTTDGFGHAIPAFTTAPFSVFVQPIDSSANPFDHVLNVNNATIMTTQFTVRCNSNFDGQVGIFWIALGIG